MKKRENGEMEGRILQLYREDVEKIFKAGVGREIPDNGGKGTGDGKCGYSRQ